MSQTPLDLAASDASRERLRFVLANADYHGWLDSSALDALTGRGIAGSATLRTALETHRPELAFTRSELAQLLLSLCEQHALPIPKFNLRLHGWLADAVWAEHRVVVEVDGLRGHRSPAQLERDHQRDLELRAAGFTVLRYTWRQVRISPGLVADDLRRALLAAAS